VTSSRNVLGGRGLKGSRAGSGYLLVLIGVFALLAVVSVFLRFFDHDEFEHIHSAWYVSRGFVPYGDFFQGHHPLLWYLLAPLILLFGENVSTVLILRLPMLLLSGGSVFLVYAITRRITRSYETGLLAALLVASSVLFVEKGIEVRPDVPQTFLGLFSFALFLRFILERRIVFLAGSGLLLGLSFVFLQKAVFLLLAFGVALLVQMVRRRVTWIQVAIFSGSFSIPTAVFLLTVVLGSRWDDYLVSNWLVQLQLGRSFSPHFTLMGLAAENTGFWILLLWAIPVILCRKGRDQSLRLTFFFGLFLLAATALIKLPYKQNFLLPVSFLAVPCAVLLKVLFLRLSLKAEGKSRLVLAVVAIPMLILTVMATFSSRPQLAKVEYVLSRSRPWDRIYDGDIRFNLFRRDLHYFWYCLGPGKERDTHKRLTGGRFADFVPEEWVRELRPRFISNRGLDLNAPELSCWYKPSPFENLYERIERD